MMRLLNFGLNTDSVYRIRMASLPYLEKSTNASITNSGSFPSAVPAYDILPYATAKAALNQMMVSLAHLLNKRVRVNSILIGTVITAGYGDAGITPEMQERLNHPVHRIGRPSRPSRPEDMENAMLWVCSPAGGWVSGQTINVPGGGNIERLFGK